jgi:hypothetical protein
MYSNIETIIYCFIDSLCIGNRCVMVTYYVTPFASLLLHCMTHHIFCLGGMHVTIYVTPTMSSLRPLRSQTQIPMMLYIELELALKIEVSVVPFSV